MMHFFNRGLSGVRYLLGSQRVSIEGDYNAPKGGKRSAETEVDPSLLTLLGDVFRDVLPEEAGHAFWHLTHAERRPCGLCAPRRPLPDFHVQLAEILFNDVELLLRGHGWSLAQTTAEGHRVWRHDSLPGGFLTAEDRDDRTPQDRELLAAAVERVWTMYGPAGVARVWNEVSIRHGMVAVRARASALTTAAHTSPEVTARYDRRAEPVRDGRTCIPAILAERDDKFQLVIGRAAMAELGATSVDSLGDFDVELDGQPTRITVYVADPSTVPDDGTSGAAWIRRSDLTLPIGPNEASLSLLSRVLPAYDASKEGRAP